MQKYFHLRFQFIVTSFGILKSNFDQEKTHFYHFHLDCGDNSDEAACPSSKHPCLPNMFQCKSDNKCIPEYFVCDHDNGNFNSIFDKLCSKFVAA